MKYQNILQTIGHTPLVRINGFKPEARAEIYVKFEALNPSGSIKDRIALYMVKEAEEKGVLKKGATIIEATTGNTGIAFAMVAAIRGYKMIAVMPENMSVERQLIMKAFGAKIFLTPAILGPKAAIAKRDELNRQLRNSWIPGQFENIDNTKAHELSTAAELIDDTDGQIDAFVAGVGTGGTLIGTANALKKVNPHIIIVAVEPLESAVLSGRQEGRHNIQGIGEGFIPILVNLKIINRIEKVSTREAADMARKLAAREGMLVGTSSGANLIASLRIAQKLGKEKTVVTIFPDRGERYLSVNQLLP